MWKFIVCLQNRYKFSVRFCRNIFYCKTPVSAASHCNILYGNSICSISGSTLPLHPSARLGKRRSKTLFQTAFPGLSGFRPVPGAKNEFLASRICIRAISLFFWKEPGIGCYCIIWLPACFIFTSVPFCCVLLYASFALFFIDINCGQAADYYRIGALDYFMVTTESQQA